MRAVIQRVRSAAVKVEERTIASSGRGLLIFLGVGNQDETSDADLLAEKIAHLRIFEDDQGKMNLSAVQMNANILVVSQFTLFGDCRKGRRPSFTEAMPPDRAQKLYERFVKGISVYGLETRTGVFQKKMLVRIDNDGPVTFIIDTRL